MGNYVSKIGDIAYHYDIEKNIIGIDVVKEVTITEVDFFGSLLIIPEEIDGMKVTKLDKKALLGKEMLKELELPASLAKLENWSIAQCRNLRQIRILNDKVVFGKGVFDECSCLEMIFLGDGMSDNHAALLALTPCVMEAEYLLAEKYSGFEEWCSNWDARLNSILKEADDDGYTALVLCGEEDILKNPEEFCRDKRKKKSYLCMRRLFHDEALSESYRSIFTDYVLSVAKGCATDESWQVMLESFSDKIPYYELYASLGGITKDNIDEMLSEMGVNHTEAKAYLMKYKQDNFKSEINIFDSFSL